MGKWCVSFSEKKNYPLSMWRIVKIENYSTQVQNCSAHQPHDTERQTFSSSIAKLDFQLKRALNRRSRNSCCVLLYLSWQILHDSLFRGIIVSFNIQKKKFGSQLSFSKIKLNINFYWYCDSHHPHKDSFINSKSILIINDWFNQWRNTCTHFLLFIYALLLLRTTFHVLKIFNINYEVSNARS